MTCIEKLKFETARNKYFWEACEEYMEKLPVDHEELELLGYLMAVAGWKMSNLNQGI